MNEATIKNTTMSCSNNSSKIDIEATSLNCHKTIEIKEDSNINLSRVDSQNYPDETKNLDEIARKLRLNKHLVDQNEQSQSNHLSKIEEGASHDSPVSQTRNEVSQKEEEVIPETPSKTKSKKRNFMNLFRRISHQKSKSNKSTPNKNRETKTDPTKETPNKVSRQKSLRKILLKFGRKKDKSAAVVKGDGPSSITSSITNNPLNGNYTVSCNDITDENIRCNMNKKDIVSVDNINCIIDKSRDNSESTISTDEILNVEAKAFINSKNNNNNNHTVLSDPNTSHVPIDSPTSDNPVFSTNYKSPLVISTTSPTPNDTNNQNSTVLESQASCLSTKSDNPIGRSNIKLSLALYGYGNYGGLRSSKNASRSCMEFWNFQDPSNNYRLKHNTSSPFTSEPENNSAVMTTTTTPIKSKSTHENMLSSDPSHNRKTKLRSHTIDKQELRPIREKQVTSMVITNGNHEFNASTNHNESSDTSTKFPETELKSPTDSTDTNSRNVVMRSQSNRPGDIQLRKSRGVSANHTRSSLIMLAVTHNSPRGKSVHPIKTPQSPTQLAIGSYSPPPCMKLTENGGVFDQYSSSSPTNVSQLDSSYGLVDGDSSTLLATQSKINGDIVQENGGTVSNVTDSSATLINNIANESEKDGQYYLNQVNKCEVDILSRVDTFQNALDQSNELGISSEMQDQLRAIIGKSRLLVSEKFDQFKGLCEQNLTDAVADEGYRTLLSDLDGFWSMVLIQVDEITREIDRCDSIKQNGWKELPIDQVDSSGQRVAPKKKIVKKRVPKSSATNAKNSPNKKAASASDIERAKAARQRIEEYKRKAMAAKQLQNESAPTSNNDSEILIIQ